jgi:hypothetical protein
MANRFEGRWSCFIVHLEDGGHDHELRFIGTMYLEFKTNGDLERGHLEYDEDEVHLTGTSSRIGEPRIRLESEFHDSFEGILTFENDDLTSFATTGKLHLAEDSGLRNRLLKDGILRVDQDDPPWVITKP